MSTRSPFPTDLSPEVIHRHDGFMRHLARFFLADNASRCRWSSSPASRRG